MDNVVDFGAAAYKAWRKKHLKEVEEFFNEFDLAAAQEVARLNTLLRDAVERGESIEIEYLPCDPFEDMPVCHGFCEKGCPEKCQCPCN